jgi:hypothetical protein
MENQFKLANQLYNAEILLKGSFLRDTLEQLENQIKSFSENGLANF